jgi:hypothetical protein
MKVLSLSTGQDLAGIGVRMAQAFARHAPDWEYRATASSTTYIDYPVDVPYRQQDAERLYDAADVVHLHGNLERPRLVRRRTGQADDPRAPRDGVPLVPRQDRPAGAPDRRRPGRLDARPDDARAGYRVDAGAVQPRRAAGDPGRPLRAVRPHPHRPRADGSGSSRAPASSSTSCERSPGRIRSSSC